MNPASIAKRALPMARRIWGLVPASLRAPLLAAAAVGGVVLVVTNRGELRKLRERDAAAAEG